MLNVVACFSQTQCTYSVTKRAPGHLPPSHLAARDVTMMAHVAAVAFVVCGHHSSVQSPYSVYEAPLKVH